MGKHEFEAALMADCQTVHYGRVYVTRGAVMSAAVCGAKGNTEPGSVGLCLSSAWQLVDCPNCLARQPKEAA